MGQRQLTISDSVVTLLKTSHGVLQDIISFGQSLLECRDVFLPTLSEATSTDLVSIWKGVERKKSKRAQRLQAGEGKEARNQGRRREKEDCSPQLLPTLRTKALINLLSNAPVAILPGKVRLPTPLPLLPLTRAAATSPSSHLVIIVLHIGIERIELVDRRAPYSVLSKVFWERRKVELVVLLEKRNNRGWRGFGNGGGFALSGGGTRIGAR
jgi:hypothetical protein